MRTFTLSDYPELLDTTKQTTTTSRAFKPLLRSSARSSRDAFDTTQHARREDVHLYLCTYV